MKKFHVFLFSFFLYNQLSAQFITADQSGNYADVEYMINNVLIDPAVSAQMSVSNIKLNGVAVTTGVPTTNEEIGYFSNFVSTANPTPPAIGFAGFETGLFMSTGEVSPLTNSGGGAVTTTNNDADDHLANQLQDVGSNNSLNNLTTIEFDFVAAGSSVSFDYIFASMEYTSYTCSQFNDIFGFFISGPGIDDQIASTGAPNLGFEVINGLPYPVYNMAKVPDQDNVGSFLNIPVVINSINSGTPANDQDCLDVNPDYMLDNIYFVGNQGAPNPTNIGFNGHTTTLTALANIQCGETYHMKLAIADVSDGALNSAVLLKEGSFTIASGETTVSSEFNQSDSIIIEGCYPGSVTVEISEINPSAATEILVDVSGSAVEGIDFTNVIDTLIIPPGDSTGEIVVSALTDNLIEGNESIIITTKVCASIISTDTIWIADPDAILVELDAPDDTTVCANSTEGIVVNAAPNGGYEPFSYQWFYNGVLQSIGPSAVIPPALAGEHICIITGDCGYSAADTFVINHFPPVPEATFTSFFNLETDQIIEGCEYGNLTFTLDQPFDVDTTLEFSVVGGSAVEGVDFYDLPTSITIPSGELSGSVNIEAIVDGQFEGDETIQIYFPFYDDCTTFPNPMTLTIISNPLLSSALEDSIFICEGEEFTAESQVIGGIEPYEYTWTNNTGGVWSAEDLTLTGQTTTTYYLQLRDACEYEYEDSVVVVVPNYEPIQISSTFSNNIVMCQDDDLHLDVDITGGTGTYLYEWRKDNIPISGEEILVVQDQDVSENDYVLEVTDECGSVAYKEFTIRVDHCEVPNIFTPNDDGLNDYFYFKSKDVEVNIRVRIMDRWGNLVYKNENYEHCNLDGIECWDGKNYISDKDCEEGVYFYTIEYNDGRLLKGTFHLMR